MDDCGPLIHVSVMQACYSHDNVSLIELLNEQLEKVSEVWLLEITTYDNYIVQISIWCSLFILDEYIMKSSRLADFYKCIR